MSPHPSPRTLLNRLAEARFLQGGRLRLYGMVVFTGFLLGAAVQYWTRSWFVDREGFPVAVDFLSFWAAAVLALAGKAATAYDVEALRVVQSAGIGHRFDEFGPWCYPPTFLFLLAPLGLLSYLQAWAAWVGATAAFFLASLRPILGRLAVAAGLAAPASLLCAMVGQNGMLTAGLMATSLSLLDRRPWLAGVSLGLLTYKPHFGLLFPLFLLLERRWTTIASAGLTALAVAGAAALAFGPGAWEGFIASLTGVTDNALLARGAEAYKLQSFYGLFYRLTGDNGLALTAHAGLAAGILAALLWLWRRPGSPALKASALLAAAFLMTPYAYTYDTPVLVVAVAFLARDGMERGFRPWDKWLLLACLFLPGLFSTLGSLAAPSACLLLLGLAFRRTLPAGMKPTGAMVQPALGSA